MRRSPSHNSWCSSARCTPASARRLNAHQRYCGWVGQSDTAQHSEHDGRRGGRDGRRWVRRNPGGDDLARRKPQQFRRTWLRAKVTKTTTGAQGRRVGSWHGSQMARVARTSYPHSTVLPLRWPAARAGCVNTVRCLWRVEKQRFRDAGVRGGGLADLHHLLDSIRRRLSLRGSHVRGED